MANADGRRAAAQAAANAHVGPCVTQLTFKNHVQKVSNSKFENEQQLFNVRTMMTKVNRFIVPLYKYYTIIYPIDDCSIFDDCNFSSNKTITNNFIIVKITLGYSWYTYLYTRIDTLERRLKGFCL